MFKYSYNYLELFTVSKIASISHHRLFSIFKLLVYCLAPLLFKVVTTLLLNMLAQLIIKMN